MTVVSFAHHALEWHRESPERSFAYDGQGEVGYVWRMRGRWRWRLKEGNEGHGWYANEGAAQASLAARYQERMRGHAR